jgi:hypothetical protein
LWIDHGTLAALRRERMAGEGWSEVILREAMTGKRPPKLRSSKNGTADGRTRTCDRVVNTHLLYLLSYSPSFQGIVQSPIGIILPAVKMCDPLSRPPWAFPP